MDMPLTCGNGLKIDADPPYAIQCLLGRGHRGDHLGYTKDNSERTWHNDERDVRVEDIDCPKCGDSDIHIRYCDGCKKRQYKDQCRHGDPEHFHRLCRRCSYAWMTTDAKNPQVVCAR